MVGKKWMILMFILSMLAVPGSVFAAENGCKCHIAVYDYTTWDFSGFFINPVDEITIKKKTYFIFGACLTSDLTCPRALPFRFLNYKLINADGKVIKQGRDMSIWNGVAIGYVNPSRFKVGFLEVGEYQIKISYNGNVKDRIQPVVRYVPLHVVA